MVGFLLGMILGILVSFIILHYYGKHLQLKHQAEIGVIIQQHIQANEYAIS